VTEPLLVERRGDVLWLTLHRPDVLNAVNLELRDALWQALGLLRIDPTLRVAVFQGAGERAFSAGADITEFGTAPSVIEAREARLGRDLWGVMASLDLPLVAAVHGFTYGAGLELALYCDLRVAADDALLAIPEVTLGYIPAAGGSQTVPRHVARSEALRMATGGEPLTAAAAYEAGLVHAVVPRTTLEAAAATWADRLAVLPVAAVRATKRAIVEGIDLPLADGLALERRLARSVAALT